MNEVGTGEKVSAGKGYVRMAMVFFVAVFVRERESGWGSYVRVEELVDRVII